jgi:hypothetical protein
MGRTSSTRIARQLESDAQRALAFPRCAVEIAKGDRPMGHELYRVTSFDIVAPFTLRITFDDNSVQTINFRPVLEGELFGPLKDLAMFNQVRLDPEIHTLIWPNDADFDPETLRNWPLYAEEMIKMAQSWTLETA